MKRREEIFWVPIWSDGEEINMRSKLQEIWWEESREMPWIGELKIPSFLGSWKWKQKESNKCMRRKDKWRKERYKLVDSKFSLKISRKKKVFYLKMRVESSCYLLVSRRKKISKSKKIITWGIDLFQGWFYLWMGIQLQWKLGTIWRHTCW